MTGTVSAGATTGAITVTVSGGTASLTNFTIKADADGDGMSDEFEQLYFGSTTAGSPVADSDGDGTSNLDEYRAGTHPFSSASVFSVRGMARDPGGVVTFTFSSVSENKYRAEHSDSLNPGAMWAPLQSNIAGTGANILVTDNSAPGEFRRFYRVVLVP